MHKTSIMLRRLLVNVTPFWVHQRGLRTRDMTPGLLVSHWQKVFQDHQIPDAQDSSEILVSHALGAKTFRLIPPALSQRPVSDHQLQRIERMGQQRLQRVPVQYIIEEWDFLDMTLLMRPPVFIPRPETEELVGLVLADGHNLLSSWEPRILEVGCGSGAVSLALLQRLPQRSAPRGTLRVCHLSLRVSSRIENFLNCGFNCSSDIYQVFLFCLFNPSHPPDPPERLRPFGLIDTIVSNPPYIFTSDMSQLDPEIYRYEDHTALDGGPDGMDVIKGILRLAPRLLKQDGDVFLEGDPRHPEMLSQWLTRNPSVQLRLISTVRDFCKKQRFVHLRRS
uniref:HemK methyltransferase family member 1 n=1 Tax=Leptobrachium leishanense TaxID=445787 RepID=A0A8C5WCF8_9ANUR